MDNPGPILAIDTSTPIASVGLYHGRVLAELSWRAERRHTAELLPAIDALLKIASFDKRALRLLAVARGPGSYSGLRVGISTALGLALALGLEVVAVPTLQALAWGLAEPGRVVRTAVEVGRGRYASAIFRGPTAEPASDVEVMGLSALLALQEDARLIVDVAPGDTPAESMVLSAPAVPRAGALAECAHWGLVAGRLTPSRQVEPIYLQP